VAAHHDLVTVLEVGAQGLAEAAGIVGDEAGGGGEDMGRRAVVALQPNDLR
jgi:hypothetical protein